MVAAYAVVGERQQGTLEPVLTTPVRREEFLLGRALASFVVSLGIGALSRAGQFNITVVADRDGCPEAGFSPGESGPRWTSCPNRFPCLCKGFRNICATLTRHGPSPTLATRCPLPSSHAVIQPATAKERS